MPQSQQPQQQQQGPQGTGAPPNGNLQPQQQQPPTTGPGAGAGGPAQPEPEVVRNLMINYIPTTIDENQLRQLFEMYGPIESVKIVCDRETRTSKGYGFVKFRYSFSTVHAIQYLNGYPLMNKRLKVSYANQSEAQRNLASMQSWQTPYGPSVGGAYPQTAVAPPGQAPSNGAQQGGGQQGGQQGAATPQQLQQQQIAMQQQMAMMAMFQQQQAMVAAQQQQQQQQGQPQGGQQQGGQGGGAPQQQGNQQQPNGMPMPQSQAWGPTNSAQ